MEKELIEEQAVEIQKLRREKQELVGAISFAVYFMREAGFHCLHGSDPEYKMYKEFKDILEEVKICENVEEMDCEIRIKDTRKGTASII